MSEATPPKPAADATGGAAKKGGNRTVLIVAVVAIVNLLALGALGYFVFFKHPAAGGGSPGKEAKEKPDEADSEESEGSSDSEGDDEEDDEDKPKKKDVGPIIPIESIVANLAASEGQEAAYLKISIAIRIKDEESKELIEQNIIPIKDSLMAFLSSLSIADTQGLEKQNAIKEQIKARIQKLLPKKKIVRAVYFTEFVVQ